MGQVARLAQRGRPEMIATPRLHGDHAARPKLISHPPHDNPRRASQSPIALSNLT